MFNGNNGYNKDELKRQPYDTCSNEFLHAICGDDNADTDASANANVKADDERLTAAMAAYSKGCRGRAAAEVAQQAAIGKASELVNKSP